LHIVEIYEIFAKLKNELEAGLYEQSKSQSKNKIKQKNPELGKFLRHTPTIPN
jgi:hypothetical protein